MPGQTGRFPIFREPKQPRKLWHVRLSGESIPYLSPVRVLPSIMTLLKIRLIRVW